MYLRPLQDHFVSRGVPLRMLFYSEQELALLALR
jgi:hypothetical protein